MEPATDWGVHGGLCVDTLRSVRVKKKRITEIYDYVNWSKGHPLPLWVVKSTYMWDHVNHSCIAGVRIWPTLI